MMIVVVSADVDARTGNFDFYPSDVIKKNSKFVYTDASGKSFRLRPLKTLNRDMTKLIRQIKPMLAGALGKMGRNFNFLTFSNRDASGNRLISPYKNGTLKITLTNNKGRDPKTLEMETLLDALHVPRKCPNGKNAHVSWKYCPWSGNALNALGGP